MQFSKPSEMIGIDVHMYTRRYADSYIKNSKSNLRLTGKIIISIREVFGSNLGPETSYPD